VEIIVWVGDLGQKKNWEKQCCGSRTSTLARLKLSQHGKLTKKSIATKLGKKNDEGGKKEGSVLDG